MGLLNFLEKGVNKFFDGLKKGAADSVTKKAEMQDLPPHAIEAMKSLEDNYHEFMDMLENGIEVGDEGQKEK